MYCNELLEKRILILSGKGGVGKSVLAATLAWIAGQKGKRTLLIELDTIETLPKIFNIHEDGEIYRENLLAKNIFCLHVDGKSGLEEYLELVLRSKRFAQRIFQSPLYQYFVNIAPGLKELMAVGKIWDIEQKKAPKSDHPLYDLLIVDTPATGHTITYLQMPMTAAKTVKKGFVNKEAQKVVGLLRDPSKTAFNIVTTLAEMPVNESVDLYSKIKQRLKIPMGCLFINQVYPPFFRGSDLEAFTNWQKTVFRQDNNAKANQGVSNRDEQNILACAESWKQRREAQELQWEKLEKELPVPSIVLPLVAGAESDLEMIQQLAGVLEAAKGNITFER